jgi:hypothetical protein
VTRAALTNAGAHAANRLSESAVDLPAGSRPTWSLDNVRGTTSQTIIIARPIADPVSSHTATGRRTARERCDPMRRYAAGSIRGDCERVRSPLRLAPSKNDRPPPSSHANLRPLTPQTSAAQEATPLDHARPGSRRSVLGIQIRRRQGWMRAPAPRRMCRDNQLSSVRLSLRRIAILPLPILLFDHWVVPVRGCGKELAESRAANLAVLRNFVELVRGMCWVPSAHSVTRPRPISQAVR